MSEPYDPHIPAHDTPPTPGPSNRPTNSRTAAIQAQIDDTVQLMRENITKVHERGESLNSLQDKTEALAVSSQVFARTAKRVRRKMWLQDMKMRIIIGVTVAVILTLVILSIVQAIRRTRSSSSSS